MSSRASAGLLLGLGLFTVGTGLYLVFLRPSVLPEDLRFAGVDRQAIPEGILDWLEIVFRTWGGFVLGFGIALVGGGTALIAGRLRWLRYGGATAVLVAFGPFLASNWVLQSDFLWFIAALFVAAAATAISLVIDGYREDKATTRPG